MRNLKEESACNIEQAIDLTSAVVELHRLGSQELNKLLRDSEILTIQRCTEKGSSVQVDMERLAWSLPLHLIAVLVSPGGDEARLRYLLCGFRLLHCLSDLAHRHSKLEQILLEEVKITEQILDLVFYMLTVLARYEHVEQENNVTVILPLLHSTLVACSFHLLTGYISSQWQDLAHVLVAHPKVDVFMDVAFHAVHIDIKFLQIKLSALNDDLMQKNPAAAEKIAHILCQQCEASLQFLHSLCQQKLFRERLLRNKELCKNGGILSLARAVLKLDISSRFGESSNVVAVVSRLKSKVLSILLQLCETESISYLDEVASSQRSMQLAKCTVLEIVELLKTAFGRKSRQSNNCVGNSNPRGLVHLNSMRLTDIFSDDSNFRYFITTNITHVLVEILSLPHEEFFSSWCSTDHQVVEEDASIEYDPFVAAGVVLATLPMDFETSFPPNVTNTERNFTVNRVRQTSYMQQRTSLLVKIIANLHCFVPNICEEQERNLFFNKFLECLQMELPKSSSLITCDTYKPRAITVYQNLCSLLDHAASLIPNFLNEEDVQLLSKFLEQLQIQITPLQFEANSDQKQIQENKIEGPLLWNKFPNPDVGERHKEARSRGGYASCLTRKVDAKGWEVAPFLRHKSGDLKEGISESSPHQDGSMKIGRSIGKRTSRSPSEPLREIDKDVGNVETSGSDASSTRGNNSHDQTLDNDDLTKLATNCENGRIETTNSVVKQRRNRKRKIMNSRQVSLIEHALLDEPEMQRNAAMLQSWAEKLSTHGSQLTPSQLKNWLNNRKARLARQAKETRTPSEGDIAFPDRSSGGILGHFYYDSPESPSEEYYAPSTTRRGTNQSTPNVGVVTLRTRSNETSEIATTDLVDCKPHQNTQMNSTPSRYVRCNPGQKVSLTDVEGKEVGRGKVYQVEGRWHGKNLEEARIHIVDVHELKVEGRTSLPHPSEAAGTTFSEAVAKNGVMRVAWDASNILLLPQ